MAWLILASIVFQPNVWAQAGPSFVLPPQQPQTPTLTGGIDRSEGTESTSGIRYVRLILDGSLRNADSAAVPAPDPPPMLIARCSLRPNGKYVFETFASFGGPVDLNFYPPWTRKDSHELFAPATVKSTITMAFLGYTHLKPFRREWEIPVQTPLLYRYNSPGMGSSNLEDAAYFLRYLLALPTLELTLKDRVAHFETTPLLAAIRKEDLCHAAGL
jgi:hypothetical protein